MNPTKDTLLEGALTLWQPARNAGYRFNLDPVLLSGFVPPADHVIDLGAGCGVLGLLLMARGLAKRVTAVEIQPELAELCARNARDNGFASRFRVECADLREMTLEPAGRVVFNPPYFKAGTGRPAANPGRDAGRREKHGTLADFATCAVTSLSAAGSVCVIVRAERSDELSAQLRALSVGRQRRRVVLPRQGEVPGHVLVEAARGDDSVVEESALIVHGDVGREFSEEVRALLRAPDT